MKPDDDRVVLEARRRRRRSGRARSGSAVDARHLLLPREQAEAGLAPRRGEGERVERLEAEQQRHRAAVHLRAHAARPRRPPPPTGRAAASTRSGSALFWREGERDRPADGRGQAAHPVHLPLGRGQVLAERAGRRQLEHAGAELAEHPADAEQLVLGREGARAPARRRWRGGRACGWSRSPSAPASMPASHDGGHRLDVVGRGRLVARPALAHHVAAHGAVGHLRAEVHHVGALRRARRGTRGRSPSPTGCRRSSAAPGMSSTPSIRPISHSCRSGATGAKPTPQLPITTVVTPCQHDGVSCSSQVAWPS